MNDRLLGFFSGFPGRSFPWYVARRLGEELTRRESLVFVSAWPDDFARNDGDSSGMHGMFEEIGLPFDRHCVIDRRMEAASAARLIGEASCMFLMGGHPGQQMRLLLDYGLDEVIRTAGAAVLGVSAGAINMAVRSLDTKESPAPYAGLGLANVTVKPHFDPGDQQVLNTLLEISDRLPICAMEDDSAIFVTNERISDVGDIHWIHKGKMCPLWQSDSLWRLNDAQEEG